MVLGWLGGVVTSEFWRFLHPPEELVLLRQLHREIVAMPTATPSPLESFPRQFAEKFALYQRGMLRAGIATYAAWLSFGAAILAGSRGQSETVTVACGMAFICLAAASIILRQRTEKRFRKA
ncbi:MAG: hypothetical protein QM741_06900 [Rudaea sp.]|uniref:hypothetical protein n=1 Tax=Rudaea sp. TaxID=2136325 RepID=UPI0039E56B4D